MAGVASTFGVTAMIAGCGGGSVCVTSGLFCLAGIGSVLGIVFGKGLASSGLGLMGSAGFGSSGAGSISFTGFGFFACTISTVNTSGTFLSASNLKFGMTATSKICNINEQTIAQTKVLSPNLAVVVEFLIEMFKWIFDVLLKLK